MFMHVLSAALLLAGEGAALPCSVLSADGFIAVKPPSNLEGQAKLAGAGARLALASTEKGKVSLWLWEGKGQWSERTLDPAGLDLRGLRVSLGASNTLVLYDYRQALIFEDNRWLGAVALPATYPQEVRVEEDGIYFFLAPIRFFSEHSTSLLSFPGARPGAQPLILRTTLKGTNPQVLLDYLPNEHEDGVQQARALLENWIPAAGGRYVVFPYSGQVRWESPTGKRTWPAPAGVRFLYQEEEFQARIEKARQEAMEELARRLKSERPGEKFEVRMAPTAAQDMLATTPIFGTTGVKGRTLLATLDLASKPARSFLVYEPGWEQPRCWQLPEGFTPFSFLSWVNSAVNDQGLWLAKPLGYFPWQLLQAEPEAAQEGSQP